MGPVASVALVKDFTSYNICRRPEVPRPSHLLQSRDLRPDRLLDATAEARPDHDNRARPGAHG